MVDKPGTVCVCMHLTVWGGKLKNNSNCDECQVIKEAMKWRYRVFKALRKV